MKPEPRADLRWERIDTSALSTLRSTTPDVASTGHTVTFLWQPSSTVDPETVSEIRRRYERAANWWAPYATSANPVKVLVGSVGEIDWICAEKLAWLERVVQADCAAHESEGRPDILTAGQFQLGSRQVDMYQVRSRESLDEGFFLGRVEHEFTHNIFYTQAPDYQRSVPCWFTEGGAEYFGTVAAYHDDPERYLQIRNWKLHTDPAGRRSAGEVYDYLVRTDRRSDVPAQGDHCAPVRRELYHQSLLASEYLVSRLGVAGYLTLIADSARSGWDNAVLRAFGIPPADLYADIARYTQEQYDLVVANPWSYEKISRIPFGR